MIKMNIIWTKRFRLYKLRVTARLLKKLNKFSINIMDLLLAWDSVLFSVVKVVVYWKFAGKHSFLCYTSEFIQTGKLLASRSKIWFLTKFAKSFPPLSSQKQLKKKDGYKALIFGWIGIPTKGVIGSNV